MSYETKSSATEDGTFSFIDYIPPPATKLQPPAKYKLWLIVLVLVFFAEWFAAEANFLGLLDASGRLGPNASLFLMLGIIVFVLVFAALDLVVALLTVEVRGRSYGIGPWLKQPRVKWIRRCDNVLAEFVACLVTILEEGFSMFDAPGTVNKLPVEEEPKEYECGDSGCDVVLKIEHHVNPEKLKQYQEWLYKIKKAAVRSARGLKNIEELSFVDSWDEEEGGTMDAGGQSCSDMGNSKVIYLTFSCVDDLNEWMTSPTRKKFMRELQPLLMEPDIVQVQNNRALPDAFTDLLNRQGEAVPVLQPKKWKVWWLTLLGLFFTRLWRGAALPYYVENWGIDDVHARLQGFVGSLFSTFLNSYVMTPLLLFLFSDWVRRKESENDEREPWRMLNDGIQSIWLKLLLTLGFYGGCAIAWALNS